MPSTSRSWWCAAILALAAASADARTRPTIPRPADPFADPRHDPYNPLKYIASNVLTGIAFGLVMLVALTQTFYTVRWGARFMLAMVIGEYCFAIGIATRFGLHVNPEGKTLYIIEYLFIVLSPCAFIAADYVLLGRLASHLKCDAYLLVPARRITAAFVSSDITTFLIQASGGALSVSTNDPDKGITGSHIFLAGLALQCASFASFSCLYLVFLYRVHKRNPSAWSRDAGAGWHRDWRTLAGALLVSCIGILIRSIYRVIELSQGYQGALATSEAHFYGLDTLPLFVAIAIYVPFWPGWFIPQHAKDVEVSEGDHKESSIEDNKA